MLSPLRRTQRTSHSQTELLIRVVVQFVYYKDTLENDHTTFLSRTRNARGSWEDAREWSKKVESCTLVHAAARFFPGALMKALGVEYLRLLL